MDSDAEQPEVGRVVDGKYRLARLLGRGGMGSVWEGVHTKLGTRFALKYIDAAFAGRKDVQTRFANEALAAARLKSKHIVEVYDHGVDERGCPYIVMEFLSGEALDQRLARDGRLSLEDTAALVLQVARALSRAHAAGIVHRDLKPENVFLVWDEEDQRTMVKLVDFGIAKFTDGTGLDTATRTGAVIGTPHYMSPEQARGLKTVDFAADVWSLGVIAYRCVTGQAPFEGEAVGDLLVKICTTPHVPASSLVAVPQGFDAWIDRSLAKDPRDRYASIAAQAEALSALVGTADLALSRPGAAQSARAGDSDAGQASAAAALTAPMHTPPGQFSSAAEWALERHDTTGGVERPRSGRAPSGRRLWLAALPVAGLVAGAWLAVRAKAGDSEGVPAAAIEHSAATATPPSASATPAQSALAAPSTSPDAGVPKPGITLGRPADSALPRVGKPARPRPGRPPSLRPEPQRPTPRDELGY